MWDIFILLGFDCCFERTIGEYILTIALDLVLSYFFPRNQSFMFKFAQILTFFLSRFLLSREKFKSEISFLCDQKRISFSWINKRRHKKKKFDIIKFTSASFVAKIKKIKKH